jgi:dipeptidyl aminopeptidase/acylaminoacyl peptidase
VVDAAGGRPRRLTGEPGRNQWPAWSRDGQWIYFQSDRTGTWQTWKVPAAGGTAVQVTSTPALKARESPDGRFLVYADEARGMISRIPVAGGEPVRVFDFPDPDHVHWGGEWVVADSGLYFLKTGPGRPSSLEFFDFATNRTTTLFTPPGPYDVGSGFAVSPDGTWLLYPQRDFIKSEIMMMEVNR